MIPRPGSLWPQARRGEFTQPIFHLLAEYRLQILPIEGGVVKNYVDLLCIWKLPKVSYMLHARTFDAPRPEVGMGEEVPVVPAHDLELGLGPVVRELVAGTAPVTRIDFGILATGRVLCL